MYWSCIATSTNTPNTVKQYLARFQSREWVSECRWGLPVWVWHLNLKHDNKKMRREIVVLIGPEDKRACSYPCFPGPQPPHLCKVKRLTLTGGRECIIWATHDALRRGFGLVIAGVLWKLQVQRLEEAFETIWNHLMATNKVNSVVHAPRT